MRRRPRNDRRGVARRARRDVPYAIASSETSETSETPRRRFESIVGGARECDFGVGFFAVDRVFKVERAV